MAKSHQELLDEKKEKETLQLIKNRRKRFKKALGEECEFIDALVIRLEISPEQVESLVENGCPEHLIKEILL